jgi:hypothetical protein
MTYTFNDYIEYAAGRLEIPLDEKRHIIGALVIEALRDAEIKPFCTVKTVSLPVIDGIVELPTDLYDIQGDSQYLIPYRKGMSTLVLPRHFNGFAFTYLAMPSGDDGLPLVPETFDKAILLYIEAEAIMRPRWRLQKASRADYEYSKKDYRTEMAYANAQIKHITPAQFNEYLRVRMRNQIHL